MKDAYNFFGQSPAPQAFAPVMMASIDASAAPQPVPQQSGAIPSVSPQQLAAMMQNYPKGYTDSAGVGADALNAAQISPGATNAGPFGLLGTNSLGGGGNPLNLTGGNKLMPDDLLKLQGAFNG